MKTFIFVIAIPAITGVITAACGISYFDQETVKMAIAINFPICILSAMVYTFTD